MKMCVCILFGWCTDLVLWQKSTKDHLKRSLLLFSGIGQICYSSVAVVLLNTTAQMLNYYTSFNNFAFTGVWFTCLFVIFPLSSHRITSWCVSETLTLLLHTTTSLFPDSTYTATSHCTVDTSASVSYNELNCTTATALTAACLYCCYCSHYYLQCYVTTNPISRTVLTCSKMQ